MEQQDLVATELAAFKAKSEPEAHRLPVTVRLVLRFVVAFALFERGTLVQPERLGRVTA